MEPDSESIGRGFHSGQKLQNGMSSCPMLGTIALVQRRSVDPFHLEYIGTFEGNLVNLILIVVLLSLMISLIQEAILQ
jgi:hypothetical protein